MNDKITWYREVLELEPQARLFYPLAKLLVEEGEYQEACTVLEKGLAWHPSYMQARMLLASVLQKMGRESEGKEQFAEVAKELGGSASFWHAWAEVNGAAADDALIKRFMSLVLRNVPVSFSDVVRRGLDSLEAEYGTGLAAQAEAAAHEPQPQPQIQPEAQIQVQPAPVQAENIASASPKFLQAGSLRLFVNAAEPLKAQAAAPKLSEAAPEKAAQKVQAAPADAAANACGGALDEEEDFVPGWPPQTRSMAEVLVEQGEYTEALSILRELAGKAAGAGRSELLQRLSEVEDMAGIDHAAGPQADLRQEALQQDEAQAEEAEGRAVPHAQAISPLSAAAGGAGAGQLLSMLEALADRIEDRAR